MTLYISKNGERLGPYTIAEIQQLVANGTFHASDWAWYEGITEWILLQQVPGIVLTSAQGFVPAMGATTASPTLSAPVRRPILVWIICLLYFITIPLALISLAVMPYLLSFSVKMQQHANDEIQTQLDRTTDPAQRDQLAATLSQLKRSQAQVAKVMNHGILYYGLIIFSMIINLVAAILLFTLRRSAFPAFITAFVVSLLMAAYNYATMSFPQGGGSAQTVGLVIGIMCAVINWGVMLAILFYVWSLSRRGILR
jgi:hypothetical protein